MKRGILVATLLVTAAGVASANLLSTTSSRGVATPAPQARPEREWGAVATARVVTPPVLAANATDSPTNAPHSTERAPPAKVMSPPPAPKPSVEAQQAPVPFKLKPRTPVNVPPVADKPAEAKVTDKPAVTASEPRASDAPTTEPAADAAGENAARAAIEADGYKGVKVLRKGVDGVWHASALRGKTTVMLTVDANGSVTAD